MFHKLPWIFPAFQESSPTIMRSANCPSDKNIFSFLRTALLCPHGTLLRAVQSMDSLSITGDLLSTCSESHSVQSSVGPRHELRKGRLFFISELAVWIWASHCLTCSRVQFAHQYSENVSEVNSKISSSSDGPCFCLQYLYFLGVGMRGHSQKHI